MGEFEMKHCNDQKGYKNKYIRPSLRKNAFSRVTVLIHTSSYYSSIIMIMAAYAENKWRLALYDLFGNTRSGT